VVQWALSEATAGARKHPRQMEEVHEQEAYDDAGNHASRGNDPALAAQVCIRLGCHRPDITTFRKKRALVLG
jgi:hypothetical protein